MKRIVYKILLCISITCTVFEYKKKDKFCKLAKKNQEISDKHLKMFILMDQWVRNYQNNKLIKNYLEKYGYQTIAIYGMSYIGKTLLKELEHSNIKIAYAIDRNAENIYENIDILLPEEEFAEVDLVIVTSILNYEEIKTILEKKLKCPVLSIEDILFDA